MTTAVTPVSEHDLFSDHTLANTEEVYAELRQLGTVVYLPANDAYAITRYEAIREANSDPATFSSKQVAFNPQMNEIISGTSLASDPPEHGKLRAILTDNLSPRALRSLRESIYADADKLVLELKEKGSFDGMEDLAVAFPVSVVLDLIGVQGDKRDRILPWGEAAFNLLGPLNQRAQESFPIAGELFKWTHEEMQGGVTWRRGASAARSGRLHNVAILLRRVLVISFTRSSQLEWIPPSLLLETSSNCCPHIRKSMPNSDRIRRRSLQRWLRPSDIVLQHRVLAG